MAGGKKPEQRNVRTSGGNYSESIGRDYVQGNVYYNINRLPWVLTGIVGFLTLIVLLVLPQNLTTSNKLRTIIPSRNRESIDTPLPPQEWCQDTTLSSESKDKWGCDRTSFNTPSQPSRPSPETFRSPPQGWCQDSELSRGSKDKWGCDRTSFNTPSKPYRPSPKTFTFPPQEWCEGPRSPIKDKWGCD